MSRGQSHQQLRKGSTSTVSAVQSGRKRRNREDSECTRGHGAVSGEPGGRGHDSSSERGSDSLRLIADWLLAVTEGPEPVAGVVQGSDQGDRKRLCRDLPDAGRDKPTQDEEIAAQDECRDDEEPQALVAEVSALAAERPNTVPGVVVRNGNEERADRGRQVMEAGFLDESVVDREVDDVASRADGGELRELSPVRGMPERPDSAPPDFAASSGLRHSRRDNPTHNVVV